MSKPASLHISFCVFVHHQNNQPHLGALYQRISVKFNALELTSENLSHAITHCNNHYGLFITHDAKKLLTQLKPFSKSLNQAKIWILSLDPALPENKPSFVVSLKNIGLASQKPQALIQEIKPAIKQALAEMRQFLANEIRLQQPSPEQQRLTFIDTLNNIFAQHHANSKLRTHFIAAQLGISVSTLERKCEKMAGKLPGQLLTEYRLEQARQLILTTRLQMSAIAHQTGFASSSYFSVRYVQQFGQTPTQTRNQLNKHASDASLTSATA